uniref:Uncharacterized protein n=1 Tax=Manihot esculenta TaxID=3983 RepID=A0A2C9V4H5_MANES
MPSSVKPSPKDCCPNSKSRPETGWQPRSSLKRHCWVHLLSNRKCRICTGVFSRDRSSTKENDMQRQKHQRFKAIVEKPNT